MAVKNVLADYVMEEWANKVMLTNSSVSTRGNRVPWKSKLGGMLLLRAPTAAQLGTGRVGLLTHRAECQFMWYRMMYFCGLELVKSALLHTFSGQCLAGQRFSSVCGERITHLTPARVELSC